MHFGTKLFNCFQTSVPSTSSIRHWPDKRPAPNSCHWMRWYCYYQISILDKMMSPLSLPICLFHIFLWVPRNVHIRTAFAVILHSLYMNCFFVCLYTYMYTIFLDRDYFSFLVHFWHLWKIWINKYQCVLYCLIKLLLVYSCILCVLSFNI